MNQRLPQVQRKIARDAEIAAARAKLGQKPSLQEKRRQEADDKVGGAPYLGPI